MTEDFQFTLNDNDTYMLSLCVCVSVFTKVCLILQLLMCSSPPTSGGPGENYSIFRRFFFCRRLMIAEGLRDVISQSNVGKTT